MLTDKQFFLHFEVTQESFGHVGNWCVADLCMTSPLTFTFFYLFGFLSCCLGHITEVNSTVTVSVSVPHLGGRQWLICQTVRVLGTMEELLPCHGHPKKTGRPVPNLTKCIWLMSPWDKLSRFTVLPAVLILFFLDRQGVSNVDTPEVSVCVCICGNVCFQVYLHMNVCQRERCGLSYALLIVACWLRSALIAA